MTKQESYELVPAVIDNAESLLLSAHLIWDSDIPTVSVALFIMACEELGKAHALLTYATSPNASWSNLSPWPKGNSKAMHLKRLSAYVLMSMMFDVMFAFQDKLEQQGINLGELEESLKEQMMTKALASLEGASIPNEELAQHLTGVAAETIGEALRPYADLMKTQIAQAFGSDTDEQLDQAADALHLLRLKSMYVEKNGDSPQQLWAKAIAESPNLMEAFSNGVAFNIAKFHIRYLKERTVRSWSEFQSLIPRPDVIERLRGLWSDGPGGSVDATEGNASSLP